MAITEVKSGDVVERENICGGVPTLKGTRIRVSDITIDYEYRGMSPEEIAEQYPTISISEVYAALEYYQKHKKKIRREIQEREERIKKYRGE